MVEAIQVRTRILLSHSASGVRLRVIARLDALVALDDTGFFLPMVRSAAMRALERAGLLAATDEPLAQR